MGNGSMMCGQKLSENSWLIKEEKWDRPKQAERETQFTLGNGYISSRGVLEELPYDANSGTYIAGIFDRVGSQVPELVNLPNPFQFRVDISGQKFGVVAMDVKKHNRVLDMKKGILFRSSEYSTVGKKRLKFESVRFVSAHDPHLLVMKVCLTALNAPLNLTVQSSIDVDVFNKGILTEGRKKHFNITEVSKASGIDYLSIKTFGQGYSIVYAGRLRMCRKGRCVVKGKESFKFKIRKGETVTFIKTIAVYTSREAKESAIKGLATRTIKKADKKSVDQLMKKHEQVWNEKWDIADITIQGDKEIETALRFNLYHLLIAGNKDDDQVSIGARTLSGEGYRGHVFWDTEMFILPFFIYTQPEVARNILLYRYHRLKAACEISNVKGYKGALFPWESADTGEEATPAWHKDFDGSVIRIETMNEEIHIAGDVAYGVHHYYKITGDNEFWYKHGLEIIFETARFWASRIHRNVRRKRYEIHQVMGPDEFHHNVNNNSYTNFLASWNLKLAAEMYKKIKKEGHSSYRKLKKKLGLTDSEVDKWHKVASNIHMPFNKKKKIYEAFDGYFKLKDVRITQLDDNLMPVFPANLPLAELNDTQLVKQADVVMLLHIFRNQFSLGEVRRNYQYYEKRTLHKSSLSPSIHSIVAQEGGDRDRAFHYFFITVMSDLLNIHGNTQDGMHAASLGGAWQAFFYGFAGARVSEGVLSMKPQLPKRWKKITFSIIWRGVRFKVEMSNKEVRINVKGVKKGQKLRLQVFRNVLDIEKDETCVFMKSS